MSPGLHEQKEQIAKANHLSWLCVGVAEVNVLGMVPLCERICRTEK